MNKPRFDGYKSKDFQVKNEVEDNVLKIIMSGYLMSISDNKSISAYFDKLHNKIIESNIDKVILDFTDINVMSSTYLNVFFDWFKAILKLPEDGRYKIELVYDKESDWQKVMFKSIQETLTQI